MTLWCRWTCIKTQTKLAIVAEMATYFKGRVHIISPAESDEFLGNQLRRNVEFASDYFEERGIEYTTKSASTIQVHSSRTWCATAPPLKPT